MKTKILNADRDDADQIAGALMNSITQDLCSGHPETNWDDNKLSDLVTTVAEEFAETAGVAIPDMSEIECDHPGAVCDTKITTSVSGTGKYWTGDVTITHTVKSEQGDGDVLFAVTTKTQIRGSDVLYDDEVDPYFEDPAEIPEDTPDDEIGNSDFRETED